MASTNTSFTATTYSTNLAGLYGGSYAALPTNAEQLIQLFDNSGNVQFYLDPLTSSSTIYAMVYNINTSTAVIGNYNFTGNTITNTVNANIDLGTNGQNWYFNADGSTQLPQYGYVYSADAIQIEATTGGLNSGVYADTTTNIVYSSKDVTLRSNNNASPYNWSYLADGTMVFPNNAIDAGNQPIDLKSSAYSELWWHTANPSPTAGQGRDTFIWAWENQAGIVVDSVDYGYLEWNFNSDGTLKLPTTALLGDLNNDNGVVLRAHLGATTLASYDQNQNVIADDGAVYIQTLGATTSSHQWIFAQDARTQFPNYVFPAAHGLAGQVLTDDGSGTLAWSTQTGTSSTATSVTQITAGTGTYVNTSTGAVTIWTDGPFDISTVTNQALFTTSSVTFKSLELDNSTFASTSSVLFINASGTSTYEAPTVDGYLIWAINKPGNSAYSVLDTYSNNATNTVRFGSRRARGTADAPLAVQLNDSLMRVQANGYGTTQFSGTSTGRLEFIATENWTDTARGTKLQIWANDEGSFTPTLLTTIRNNGTYIYSTGTTSAESMLAVIGVGPNTSYQPLTAAGTLIWGVNKPGLSGQMTLDTFGTGLSSRFTARTARGTSASPSAVLTDDSIGRFQVTGYGTTSFSSTASGYLDFVASENWTDTAHGTKVQIWATDEGAITPVLLTTIRNNGTYIYSTGTVSAQSMLNIVGPGPNSIYESASDPGYLVWGINKPNTAGRFTIDTYRDPSPSDGQDKTYWTGRRARGTNAAPTAVQNGDALLRITAYGYNSTQFTNTASGGMTVYAVEDFTTAASGGKIVFDVMQPGHNTSAYQFGVMTLNYNNGIVVGNKITFPNSTVQITAFTSTNAVTSITAGTGTHVSTSTGAVTIWSDGGVTSITAGTGTHVSTSTGVVTIWSDGGGGTPGATNVYDRGTLPTGTTGTIITISDSGTDTNSPAGNWAPAYWDSDASLWTYIGNSNSVTPNVGPPVIDYIQWLDASSFAGSTWTDRSVNANNATVTGSASVVTIGAGYGSSTGVSTVQGNSSAYVNCGSMPGTYTLFTVARLPDSATNDGWAFTNSSGNTWLSGFAGTYSGTAYHEGFVNTFPPSPNYTDNWLISADQNSFYRPNGNTSAQGTSGGGASPAGSWGVNMRHGSVDGLTTDWQVAEIIVYDRTLSGTEISDTEAYLAAKYGITLGV